MQRLLITFSRGEQVKYISHLDLMRFWERAFRRAKLSVATTQGFHPHPRFALAAPLPVGVTSESELLDVYLETSVTLDQCHAALNSQMVPGISVVQVEEKGSHIPSLQSLIRFADYRVAVAAELALPDATGAVARFLEQKTFPWEHLRDNELRQYDLRPQVDSIIVVSQEGEQMTMEMRLQCDSNASGRPEQVTRALGFSEPPISIHRLKLVLADKPLEQPKQLATPARRQR